MSDKAIKNNLKVKGNMSLPTVNGNLSLKSVKIYQKCKFFVLRSIQPCCHVVRCIMW
uniref:Uncharacterized protein n=1 Tax=Ascaris lumbricoides TaxID=6252 RepID=A0A0M3HN84_ASCLU